jgi:hypothetical protein
MLRIWLLCDPVIARNRAFFRQEFSGLLLRPAIPRSRERALNKMGRVSLSSLASFLVTFSKTSTFRQFFQLPSYLKVVVKSYIDWGARKGSDSRRQIAWRMSSPPVQIRTALVFLTLSCFRLNSTKHVNRSTYPPEATMSYYLEAGVRPCKSSSPSASSI